MIVSWILFYFLSLLVTVLSALVNFHLPTIVVSWLVVVDVDVLVCGAVVMATASAILLFLFTVLSAVVNFHLPTLMVSCLSTFWFKMVFILALVTRKILPRGAWRAFFFVQRLILRFMKSILIHLKREFNAAFIDVYALPAACLLKTYVVAPVCRAISKPMSSSFGINIRLSLRFNLTSKIFVIDLSSGTLRKFYKLLFASPPKMGKGFSSDVTGFLQTGGICSCINNCHGHGACEESPVVGGEKTKKRSFLYFLLYLSLIFFFLLFFFFSNTQMT